MINTGKTVEMSYHTMQSKLPMRPKMTAYKSDTKFLGIHITENLKWTTHIHILKLQLNKVCYIIKSVQGIVGWGISFYHSKFESIVRYGIIFGGQIMKLYLYLSYRRG